MKPSRKEQGSRRGFTLAELMVVIVIIALLATMVVPRVVDKLFKSQIGVAKGDITTIVGSLQSYAVENNGKYPESLEALVTPDANGNKYLEGDIVPRDPWGNEYGYEPPGSGQPEPRVFTYGADGAPGGEGKDRDFDNIMIRNREI